MVRVSCLLLAAATQLCPGVVLSQGTPQNPIAAPAAKVAAPIKKIEFGVIATLPPDFARQRLTVRDKFDIYVHQNYGPQNFILPAFSAAFEMARPPGGYPREWLDGGGAYGRWYANQFVAATANRSARLLGQIAFHEDPRYVPSGSTNFFLRTGHALAFTLVDKSDDGHNMPAISNMMGAAAGGFVGMSYLPPGHDDARHAEQRVVRGLGTIAVRNFLTEFRPEWEPTLKRIHVPEVLPGWWTRQPKERP
jgi:hypothetical protein